MVRRRRFILSLAAVLICGFLYLSLQGQQGTQHHRLRKTLANLSAVECSHLKSLILYSTMKIFKSKKLLEVVKSLQGCPWERSREESRRLQSQLRTCCNASFSMIVTQNNSPIGHTISYDGEKGNQSVTKELYNLFPKKSPFLKPLRSCAVVGNGGILNGSFCGGEIDRADFVFRLNFPPLNRTDDVGIKTDLVTANPSILIERFESLRERRKEFINMVKAYSSALVLLPAFSFSVNTEISFRVLYALEDFDLNNIVVFFNPDYLKRLAAHWKSKGLQFRRMSSGLMLVSAAAEVCEKVTLYGFWPFSEDLNKIPTLHHYYDNVPPKQGIHAMPEEFYQYLQMHVQGTLYLQVAQC